MRAANRSQADCRLTPSTPLICAQEIFRSRASPTHSTSAAAAWSASDQAAALIAALRATFPTLE
jgi:hypothetical protein